MVFMRLLLIAILGVFFFCKAFIPPAATSGLTHLSGTLVVLKKNFLALDAARNVRFTVPLSAHAKATSPSGLFSFAWILPGDGLRLSLNPQGEAQVVQTNISWTFGTMAFTSSHRLTLLEGPQFYTEDSTPIFLNGEKIKSLLQLKPPDEVLVRFNSLEKKVVGIWAFRSEDRLKKNSNHFQNNFWISSSLRKNQLKVSVNGEPKGVLSVQILGGNQRIRLPETAPGHYQATIVIPGGVTIPRTYLAFEWQGLMDGEKTHGKWLFSKPISYYTQPPVITDVGPSDGSVVQTNPPFIFASFDPNKAPLDSNSVRLTVDGKNVTAQCYVDPSLIFFSPKELSRGKHTCLLAGRTLGGNGPFHRKWNFYVKS